MVQETIINPDITNNDPSIKFGKILADAPPGEEIVISGMAGAFPLSENIEEYQHNLENKIEMLTEVPSVHPEMPPRFGKMKDITRFDAGFFGLQNKRALTTSPFIKYLLEKSYECIFDAGLNPADLEGTNTGVFLGICFCEVEIHWYFREHIKDGGIIIGNLKSGFAHTLSHHLKLKGMTAVTDTACSSSASALEAAYKAIRMGQCDAALVGASNLIIAGGCSLQFARLGVLSPDGHCRPFDKDGIGYVRSEAVAMLLLQKAKDSKRIYARVMHVKTNCDGYKEQGITYPSGVEQYNLLKEIYFESGIRPADVTYVEAHGTGTKAGDVEEVNTIDDFFTKERTTPLLLGSCKSSIGHSEPGSALCAIIKVLLAFETNNLTPNVNYKSPRPNLRGLVEGRLEVVVENTPFTDELIGVSSFGFGGANVHMILKDLKKLKSNNGRPTDKLPRIVCASGRTEEAVSVLLKDVAKKFDVEHIGLMHNIFRKNISNHIYRGYTIVSDKGTLGTSIKLCNPCKSNIIFFGGLNHKSVNILSELLTLPPLKDLCERMTCFFLKKNLTLDTIMSNARNTSYFLVDMLTQLTLTELLMQLEIKITNISAYSFGKFTSLYYQNIITLNEFLEFVYSFAKVIEKIGIDKNNNAINLTDFAKYKSYLLKEVKALLQPPEKISCFNSGTAPHLGSPEYFMDAIFETKKPKINVNLKRSMLLEIGQSFIDSRKIKCKILNMSQQSSLVKILEIIGSLYENGLQPQLHNLYPKVEFPVSKGTPMISSKIKWKHDRVHFIPAFDCSLSKNDAMVFKIHPKKEEWAFLQGHVVDGRNLFPATGYLVLVWTVLADLLATEISKLNVTFENCKFIRACNIPKLSTISPLELHVMIQRESGNFEVTEENTAVVTGNIKVQESHSLDESFNLNNDELDTDQILKTKDIYKELRLRGYSYKGLFKKIIQCNKNGTNGKIQWCDNWIGFMDNMLQIQILGVDTRLLYVPIKISRLTINPESHLKLIHVLREGHDDSTPLDLPVKVDFNSRVIKSGGIEIQGLLAYSITRKKTTAVPVLEKYQFIPNAVNLTLQEAVRVCIQIALENHCGLKIKAVELVDEESDRDLLAPLIQEVLGDLPLVHLDMTIFSSQSLEVDFNLENKELKDESDCTLVVGSKLLNRINLLQDALKATKDCGFIVSREPLDTCISFDHIIGLKVINVIKTLQETLVFLKKSEKLNKSTFCINISTKTRKFNWLGDLKEAVKKDNDVVVWSQNEPLNGIIGLVNCLIKEPDCSHIRSVIILDQAPPFDPTIPFYREQLDKQLNINVFKDGSWGTYRHLLLDDLQEIEIEHRYAFSTVIGDLSSIKWIEGPLTTKENNENVVKVSYSALNFKDVMTASGRINMDVITKNRREQVDNQGLEFSGEKLSGTRVMGMLIQGTLATLVLSDNDLLWEVPDYWSLREAATVPVVYTTCVYSLVVVGKIKPGDSVLIHSGTGGVGQAAINLCLNIGCLIFTTVGTEEKKKYIMRNFPQINESHIGNSRNLSFEKMIMKETRGRGVDIVLNSLVGEKLEASVRCLAKNGRFLEIGKFDLANDNQLVMLPFKEGASYHGIMVDRIFNEPPEVKADLKNLVQSFIDNGAIKPLKSTVFSDTEVEQAFRYMATGKHMGKVLIEIRSEDNMQNTSEKFKALPRYICDPTKSYIICGGLGGFGLELADWLVLKGAHNLVLTSRKGITTGYQYYRISIWKMYGCNIKISTEDMTTKQGCEALIKEANSMAPVAAIFNLAVVLRDAILENQTEESFEVSFGPKAHATEYLDELTRKLCPELRDFVVFSSVSCGRGNAGQTNYGMSNSVMERICEKRRADGYPALAIQWGAIGDVGLVAEMQEEHIELEIGGTLQQSISSCLKVMDTLLRQKEASIVSSMVVAEKKSSLSGGNIMEVISGILGIRDIKAISLYSTLAELGMDSMTGVEVKQTLEREYNIFLSPSEIRSVTLMRINEMLEEGESINDQVNDPDNVLNWKTIFKHVVASEEQKSCIVKLRSKSSTQDSSTLPRVIAFPGIEGVCEYIQSLTENLEAEVYGVTYISAIQEESIPKMADNLLPFMENLLEKNRHFNILAHSLGSSFALEVVSKLEKLGYTGTVTVIDGSPELMKNFLMHVTGEDISESNLAHLTISNLLRIQNKEEKTIEIMEEIFKTPCVDQKLAIMAKNLTLDNTNPADFVTISVKGIIKRMKAIGSYSPNFKKLKASISLFKPKIISFRSKSEDYGLGELFEQPLSISVLDGTHTTMLENQELADAVMKHIL